MKTNGRKSLLYGAVLLMAFALWTVMIIFVDVQPVGVSGTSVGLAALNSWVHSLTGVHLTIYNITDWAGLVPVAVCMVFGTVGLAQAIKRKSLFKVDCDVIVLGVYYIVVIACYIVFEMMPINYRPILINGFMETSYPSSTTLLVLGVMPTLVFQANRRVKKTVLKRIVSVSAAVFSLLMVLGRFVSGVHWLTDIVGSVFLSGGLFYIYKGTVLLICKEK